MKKRGLSAIISTVLIVALAIIMIVVIWGVVNTLIDDKLGKAESCYGTFEKIKIDEDYTCYNSDDELLNISISREDIEIDSLTIGIWGESQVITKEIFNDSQIVSGVFYLGDDLSGDSEVALPSKEGGKTYLVDGIDFEVKKIEIAPKINGNLCETVDYIDNIFPCI